MNLSLLSEQIAQQDAIEWAGLITGVAYVLLATYRKPLCWVFGILSCACIAWKSFTDYHLVADGILQVFYIGIGFIGLWQWMKGNAAGTEKPIVTSAYKVHLISIGICLLLSWPLSWVLITYANASYGYPDTLLTLLSVWATLLLIRKDLSNWLYWIGINALYLGLYWQSEGYLFAVLYLVYAVISIIGWKKWNMHFANFNSPN
jgi:nicotinamide mononucleotide transporter